MYTYNKETKTVQFIHGIVRHDLSHICERLTAIQFIGISTQPLNRLKRTRQKEWQYEISQALNKWRIFLFGSQLDWDEMFVPLTKDIKALQHRVKAIKIIAGHKYIRATFEVCNYFSTGCSSFSNVNELSSKWKVHIFLQKQLSQIGMKWILV